MNDSNPTPPDKTPNLPERIPSANPPLIPSPTPLRYAAAPPLLANPEDLVPIPGLVATVEAILRQPRRVMFQLRQPGQGRLIAAMLVIALASSLIYGIVVGTFSGGQQLWGAPVKIAAGLLISALICLPSLYIFSCLGGSQARLVEVFGLLAGLLALTTVLLIGFAPVAWVFSESTKSLAVMGALHIGFWLVAVFFGLRFLYAGFKHLGTPAMSGGGVHVWVIIFLLVALQMTTALRPIVGTADTFLPKPADKKFFLGHWMDCLDQQSSDHR